jgi:hypothetical protein
MIELMHDAYNKYRMHVHKISMKDKMIGTYECEFVHVDMLVACL